MPIRNLTEDQKKQMHRDNTFLLNEWQRGAFDDAAEYVDHAAAYNGKIVGYGNDVKELRERLSLEFNVPTQCIATTYIGTDDYGVGALTVVKTAEPQP